MSEPESQEVPTNQAADAGTPHETPPTAIAEGEIFGDVGEVPKESDPPGPESKAQGIDAILGVSINVQIVLGGCHLPISDLLKLGRGSIIELDRRIGQPVDVMVNGRLVARGDLLKLEDDAVGVTLKEMIKEPGYQAE